MPLRGASQLGCASTVRASPGHRDAQRVLSPTNCHQAALEAVSWLGHGPKPQWVGAAGPVPLCRKVPGCHSCGSASKGPRRDLSKGLAARWCQRDGKGKGKEPGEVAVGFPSCWCRRNCFKMSSGVLGKANSW